MQTRNKPTIHISKPCHEDWQQMTPQEKGRYCDRCCLVVTDFTAMSQQEIIHYLSERKQQRVCGRFRKEQISSPEALSVSTWQRLTLLTRKYAALFFTSLLLGASACKEAATTHLPIVRNMNNPLTMFVDTNEVDTTEDDEEQELMGEVAAPTKAPTPSQEPQILLGDTILREEEYMGKVKLHSPEKVLDQETEMLTGAPEVNAE